MCAINQTVNVFYVSLSRVLWWAAKKHMSENKTLSKPELVFSLSFFYFIFAAALCLWEHKLSGLLKASMPSSAPLAAPPKRWKAQTLGLLSGIWREHSRNKGMENVCINLSKTKEQISDVSVQIRSVTSLLDKSENTKRSNV